MFQAPCNDNNLHVWDVTMYVVERLLRVISGSSETITKEAYVNWSRLHFRLCYSEARPTCIITPNLEGIDVDNQDVIKCCGRYYLCWAGSDETPTSMCCLFIHLGVKPYFDPSNKHKIDSLWMKIWKTLSLYIYF